MSLLAAVIAIGLAPIAVAPSPSPAAIPCGSIEPRIEQLAKAVAADRPVSPPYVDAIHRPAMIAANDQADAMVHDADSCVGKYPLTFRASAYELRMTTRFYLHDAKWHEDVVPARKGFQECAATYFSAMAERCRGMVAQLDRIEDTFRRLDALFGSANGLR